MIVPEGSDGGPVRSAYEKFTAALAAQGRTLRNGKALCPAHDDHNPSLSVTQADDRILILCHAGCSAESILTALGLTMADLFDRQPMTTEATIETTYDYTDEGGNLLFQVVRYQPKGFKQRRPTKGGWDWHVRSVRRVLYRLPEVIAGVAAGKPIFITEGEKTFTAWSGSGRSRRAIRAGAASGGTSTPRSYVVPMLS